MAVNALSLLCPVPGALGSGGSWMWSTETKVCAAHGCFDEDIWMSLIRTASSWVDAVESLRWVYAAQGERHIAAIDPAALDGTRIWRGVAAPSSR